MSRSPADSITITRDDGRGFELFTSLSVRTSIARPSEASFELGDSGSWDDMAAFVSIGSQHTIAVNGRERVTGRVQILGSPLSAPQASVLRFVVRTKLADIEFAAADSKVRVKGVSIRQMVEAVLAPAGILAADIEYRADAAREVMTGRSTKGAREPKDLTPLTEQQAAVQPGETIKAFLDRHLRRHGLMIWDGPDGKVVVSEPDDDQESIYVFRCLRDNEGQFNNFLGSERTHDITGVPTSVTAYGNTGGADFRQSKISARKVNDELTALGFWRPALIIDKGMKTTELAQRTVAREYSERVRRQDFVPIQADGLGFADGTTHEERIPYSHDTCADLILGTAGGSIGKYYVEEVTLTRDARSADQAQLICVAAGTWAL